LFLAFVGIAIDIDSDSFQSFLCGFYPQPFKQRPFFQSFYGDIHIRIQNSVHLISQYFGIDTKNIGTINPDSVYFFHRAIPCVMAQKSQQYSFGIDLRQHFEIQDLSSDIRYCGLCFLDIEIREKNIG
jgi:hypothetical protein